jgi:hypothetical protein
VRPSETIKIDSLKIINTKYASVARGGRQRLFAFLRVRLFDEREDSKIDYAATIRVTLRQQKMKGLFDGLYKSKVPFVYITIMQPFDSEMDGNEVFEFDLVVGTWVDTLAKKTDVAIAMLEQRANVLAATLSVAMTNSSVRRLSKNQLSEFLQCFLLPKGPKLPQVGTSDTVSMLEAFDEQSPSATSGGTTPGFYIPNASESGKQGILLGTVKSRGGDFHEMRLQLEDLKRHTAILGVTGSGKSTSAGTIVRQVAEMGLPVMVMDWHNEYSTMITSIGGRVLAPGKDDFTLNPLQFSAVADQIEHTEMVTDIFADIYHFTHPQAYMFRNALQKCLGEAGEEEVASLSSLVRTIESYPLRSAYDNETKVALLRRIVPLTQGQAGKALNGPSTFTVDELLDKVITVELGHLRDTQTRTVVADLLLKMVYEYRMTRKGGLEHVLVIEEARNIAPVRREEDPPSVGERMISELRKFGEAMIFVAQFPTQIASEVMKNSGVRIIHRIAWAEDLRLVGEALNLDSSQQRHIAELGVGEAVLSLGRIQRPMLVQVNAESLLSLERRSLSFTAES